jgi:hypothetical protein
VNDIDWKNCADVESVPRWCSGAWVVKAALDILTVGTIFYIVARSSTGGLTGGSANIGARRTAGG